MAIPKPTENHASRPLLVLIDDDPLIIESLSFVLEDDFDVHTAFSRSEAKACLAKLPVAPSLALVDLGLPPTPHTPREGFALIGELLAFNSDMKILVLSGQNKTDNIHYALTLGAVDFIPKPCDAELLKSRLRHQLMILQAEQRQRPEAAESSPLVGNSSAMATLRGLIARFADTPFPVLIAGESGSGKELVANRLHFESNRREQPYLTINCAAFSRDLLDAQLFGHAKGAFTGAAAARNGFFEDAGEGSLLLDEIGELPLELQAKLLRVLENGEFYRLGETQARQSKARILASTNRDLRDAVAFGGFRQDLFHRLSVLTIQVPPLRERDRDSLLLLEHFRTTYAATVKPFELSPTAEQELINYGFPGNVRELRNIVIRLGAKYPGQQVEVEQLRAELETGIVEPVGAGVGSGQDGIRAELEAGGFKLDKRLLAWERQYINAALELNDGNLSRAARQLGVNRTTLYSRIQRLADESD
jgi:DNA-binding NtrC family response regulator